MKIKMIQAIKAYSTLENINPGLINKDIAVLLWKNLKVLREISKIYSDKVEEMKKKLREDPEFKKMNKAIEKGEVTDEVKNWYTKWSESSKSKFTAISETEVEINLAELPGEELVGGLNHEISFSELLELDWLIK